MSRAHRIAWRNILHGWKMTSRNKENGVKDGRLMTNEGNSDRGRLTTSYTRYVSRKLGPRQIQLPFGRDRFDFCTDRWVGWDLRSRENGVRRRIRLRRGRFDRPRLRMASIFYGVHEKLNF